MVSANRSKQEQIHYGTLMDSYFELRHPSVMLVLVDVRRGVSQDDLMMIRVCDSLRNSLCSCFIKSR
ncbi:hypothetical protein [Erysipelothrix piscisicarius]|uniref:hypothetical protein n=1 Tax=Erysipelothrix piscisicarius TaxID=2485784 RepID=UPI002F95356D